MKEVLLFSIDSNLCDYHLCRTNGYEGRKLSLFILDVVCGFNYIFITNNMC